MSPPPSRTRRRSRRQIQELESELVLLLTLPPHDDHEPSADHDLIPNYHRLIFLRNLLSAEFASDPHRLSEIIDCAASHHEVGENDRATMSAAIIQEGGPTCTLTRLSSGEEGCIEPELEEGDLELEEAGAGGEGFAGGKEPDVEEESEEYQEKINTKGGDSMERAVTVEGWGRLIRCRPFKVGGCRLIGAAAMVIVGSSLFVTMLQQPYHDVVKVKDFIPITIPT